MGAREAGSPERLTRPLCSIRHPSLEPRNIQSKRAPSGSREGNESMGSHA
jgi:hypothetical protein